MFKLILAAAFAGLAVYGGIKGPQVLMWVGGLGAIGSLIWAKLTSNSGAPLVVHFDK